MKICEIFTSIQGETTYSGLPSTFIAYGMAFAVIVLIGSTWMVNPPEG